MVGIWGRKSRKQGWCSCMKWEKTGIVCEAKSGVAGVYLRPCVVEMELISNCLAINRPRNITVAYPTNTSTIVQASAVAAVRADFTVSKGRNSRYRTVQAAVNAADFKRLNGYGRRMVIYVSAGVYSEAVTIPSTLTDLTMIGDGMGKTVITGSRSVARGYTTFSSPTFREFILTTVNI